MTFKRLFRAKEGVKNCFSAKELLALQKTLDTHTPLITYNTLFKKKKNVKNFFTSQELRYLQFTLYSIWRNGGGQPISTAKIYLTMGDLLYETESFSELESYLSTLTITAPVVVTLNANDTFYPTGGRWEINYNNGDNLFTVKAGVGKNPVVDGDDLQAAVVTITKSNIVWDGVDVLHGDPTDEGGTNIRLGGNQSNVIIKNCLIKNGYVGIRGTNNLSNILIDNVIIEEVAAGSIRLGGNNFSSGDMYEDFDLRTSEEYDMHDITVQNITCLDTLNGGFVPGTSNKFSPLIILKMTENLTVRNTIHTGQGAMVYIETSTNILLDRVKAIDCNSYGIALTGCDFVTISNSVCKAHPTLGATVAYWDTVRNLSLLHNSFIGATQFDGINTNKIRRVLKVVGNIFKFDYGTPFYIGIAATVNGTPYAASLANDFQEEHDNVFGCNDEYSDTISISRVLGGSDLRVRRVNFNGSSILSLAQYQASYSGYGVNSSLVTDFSVAFSTRVDPGGATSSAVYIPDGAPGRNIIASSLDPLATRDAAGYLRTYPTDTGAYDRDAVLN